MGYVVFCSFHVGIVMDEVDRVIFTIRINFANNTANAFAVIRVIVCVEANAVKTRTSNRFDLAV